jgi:CDP-diacylglycerol--glycerol-3-phosphate 3-phosphatidyltransferase
MHLPYKKEIFSLYSFVALLFVVMYVRLLAFEGEAFALHWLFLSVATLIIVIFQTVSRLDKNRLDEHASLYDSLGWGNRATMLRGILIAVLAGFLFKPWPDSLLIWLPGVIYTLAAVIDRVDGYLARITRMQSRLGMELDTVYDAIGLLVAPFLAVGYGQLHWSYLLVSIAYYMFVLGMTIRKKRGLVVEKLPPNISRRAIAGFQMGFVAVSLFPVFKPPITQLAGIAFMLPLLTGFIIDWFIVRGSLVQGTGFALSLDRLKVWGDNYFLPVLRLFIVVLVVVLFLGDNLEQQNSVLILVATIPVLLILTGIAGRTGAVILAIMMGVYFQDQDLPVIAIVILFGAIWISMLGTGHYSLYRRDEEWVNRYDGA